ncbi:MAG: aminopeptidase P family protein [Actinobacteria bacterium]|nr:aminopeptidase P family protein [Actinomycetota bacterium]
MIVPSDGEITVLAFPLNAWLPARRAREVVEDVRPSTRPWEDVVARLRELGAERGVVGIVETDLGTSIPSNHLDHFREQLPDVRFRSVTREWWRTVRLIRSNEEIASLERAARIGDVMSSAVAERVRPGMPERGIFAVLSEAMIHAGGEIPTMVLAASGPSLGPFDTFQRERPMNRMLMPADVILTEIAPRVPDGSECQTGRSYTFGEPSSEYRRLAEVMMETYDAISAQLRPGRTDQDVVDAAQPIRRAGYVWLSPLIHGAEGGAAGSLPMIAPSMSLLEEEPFTFAPDMVVTIEVHIAKPDYTAGLFTADTWVVGEQPRCLNQYRRELIVI